MFADPGLSTPEPEASLQLTEGKLGQSGTPVRGTIGQVALEKLVQHGECLFRPRRFQQGGPACQRTGELFVGETP